LDKKIFGDELRAGEDEKDLYGDSGFFALEDIFTDFKINGYSITNCLGQKTKNFNASLYISAVSKSVGDIVHDQISKYFSIKTENISVHTFPFVSFVVCKKLFSSLQNFLLVDISAEMTDIIFVSKESVVGVVSFPSGRNFIVRQIAKKFAVSAEIAESLLRVWNAKKSDDETTAKIQEVISDAEKEWSIYFENAFVELAKNATLPPVVCLVAGEDVESVYSDFLKTPKDDSTAEFRKNIQIFCLDTATMSHLYDSNPKFRPNVFLSVLTIFSTLAN
jgi:cell division ATPase FtsA